MKNGESKPGPNAHWELFNGESVFQVRAGVFGVVLQRSSPHGGILETIALSPEDALTIGRFLVGASRFAEVLGAGR